MEEIVQEKVVDELPSPPMGRVILNSIEIVEDDSDIEVSKRLLQFQATQVERAIKILKSYVEVRKRVQ